jgi:hypothetical protein
MARDGCSQHASAAEAACAILDASRGLACMRARAQEVAACAGRE